MPNLILEVGTEEMPSGAIASALQQLRAAVKAGLEEARLSADDVMVYGTPRRLIVRATNVPDRQPDAQREARGPAKSVAFGPDGMPTGAAVGFARKQGVPVESLEVIETPQGEYILARFSEVGKPSLEVLGAILAQAVTGLYFPKLMRWGGGAMRFVRPIRWMVAILGDSVVPMEIGGVPSGNRSRGHRFLAPVEFEVRSADTMLDQLRAAFVMVEPDERRASIRAQSEALAGEVGGRIPWDESLLDENVWLVEWPTAVLGRFDARFLDLPRPVLVTAMKKHQRYFPVEAQDGKLLPNFVAIRSGGSDHLDIVREGYERVLIARFSDAAYFHKLDRESSLEEMAGQLGRLIFQERLGTMAEKQRRLEGLANEVADLVGLKAGGRSDLLRAASLAKADLVSRMVVELPSLQGVMGREYSLAAGEAAVVADAIAEHYVPRSAGDAVPSSRLGRLLALTDRMDTLTGYLGIGIMPSGSSDPYGLRRAAHGAVQILAEEREAPSPLSLAAAAARVYQKVNGIDLQDDLYNNMRALFLQRLDSMLQEHGVRYDLAEAALGASGPYALVVEAAMARGTALQTLSEDDRFVPTVQAGARISNIVKSGGAEPVQPPGAHPRPGAELALAEIARPLEIVDSGRFGEQAERALMEAAWSQRARVADCASASDYKGLFETLQAINGPVNQLFDDVMVMVEDDAIRANRLALLRGVEALYKLMADWTRVVVP